MNSIEMKWQSYASEVLPPSAPAVQRTECRRAFYAGAISMMTIAKASGDQKSEEAGAAILQGAEDELKAFYRDVKRGSA